MNVSLKSLLYSALLGVCALITVTSLSAQEFEEQAMEILRLYEGGQTDTAYWLVEPLKRNARFVPAALYVRAQMTPDDRALGLYREVVALDPSGAYADDAAYQLVRRYVEKRDSLAAVAWLQMLEKHFPQSPYLAMARNSILTQTTWSFGEVMIADEPIEDRDDSPVGTAASGSTRPDTNKSKQTNTSKPTPTPNSPTPSPTPSASEFSGYALQVGLLPTEGAAERRAAEMRQKGLKPLIFEKDVDGRTGFAVVVGPYQSAVEAADDKVRVAAACECGAFTVLVE